MTKGLKVKMKYLTALLLTTLLITGCDTKTSETEEVENGLVETPYVVESYDEGDVSAYQLHSGSTYFRFDYLDTSCSIEINTIESKFNSINVSTEELILADYYIDDYEDEITYLYQVYDYGKLSLEIKTNDNSNAKLYFSCINSTL